MKKSLLILVLLMVFVTKSFSQTEALAQQYYTNGDYKKAVVYLEKCYQSNPQRTDYLMSLIDCYQQLQQFDKAELTLKPLLQNKFLSVFSVLMLGHNEELQGENDRAFVFYQKALDKIDENPAYCFTVARLLENYGKLSLAIEAYKKGMQLNPKFNFNYNIAKLYGEQGNVAKMFSAYLDLLAENETYLSRIKHEIGTFVNDETSGETNANLLRKELLVRLQKSPNILWNEMLSWLFIQQQKFESAFIQEKAIYKRLETASLEPLLDLAFITYKAKNYTTATKIYNYIANQTNNTTLVLEANLKIVEMEQWSGEVTLDKIQKEYEKLLEQFGVSNHTVNLQMDDAKFLAFQMNKPSEAEAMLKKTLGLDLELYDEANVKMALADILVFEEKFNSALIYYSQVQKMVKNDVLAQQARFKVAQTSFYKGDFNWAVTQLDVLKSSTSQLIANDALQLKLLISDNSLEDSTQTALKIYAKADLMAYQHKNAAAISLLEEILTKHKGESIEDEALLKQAQLYENDGEFEKAKLNYIKIITFFGNDILADDALFHLAKLYENKLSDKQKAMKYYEKIIFNHEDSIYFVAARKAYRRLRGDAI
ncbi:tetratricopeptide repeat protein [Zhouia sp. PK063]|uniref:tetratricopeptide repeat protein n=1 Tax=Zhouia sp. PK063 TaxID=3373602 RepID=UPI0037BA3B61